MSEAEASGGLVALEARALIDMQRLGDQRFRSTNNQNNQQGAIFGGQAIAQCLTAAQHTVSGWLPNSCTGYFLRAGDVQVPVDFEVECIRDGRSYAQRRVLASQAGTAIFDMLCSFHAGEPGLQHQMGDVADQPRPETLPDLAAFAAAHSDKIPERIRKAYAGAFPIELRPVDPERAIFGGAEQPERAYWFRMPSAADIDDERQHRALLGFMSDYWFPSAAGALHGGASGGRRKFSVASVQHSLWFHNPVNVSSWILYKTDSPWAGDGRAIVRGLLYDETGVLIASAAQEASMRLS